MFASHGVLSRWTTPLIALLLLAGCAGGPAAGPTTSGSPTGTVATPTTSTGATATGGTATSASPTTSPSQSYPVKVFFSRHPESDDDPSRVFPVARVAPDDAVGTYAIGELLRGPSASEKSEGYFTDVRLRAATSTCGTADFTLAVTGGVATLQFCKPFDHVGSLSDGRAESALKATLRQFPTVTKVVVLNSRGDCEFDLSGQNACRS